ncbi:hypothetical protein AtNW77_Chr4g0282211 [Arabidopsis thaliana]|uniref:Transmembrane protein n=2 Tax=Arabidopsis TaxID=3701 RepID=A0A178UUZ2_ARATH|nr:hypothetical protein ISN45_At04g009280 [Arabidopsis thaliana x Arabidopsis arenosa]OAO96662.1 hypothetical protein AXX17_AT4G10510 [Arabidopsis thaliana]
MTPSSSAVTTDDVMLTCASCFSTRWSRIIFLILCSPLLCLSIPLLCAVEIFSRLLSRIVKPPPSSAVSKVLVDDEDNLRLRQCEEGFGMKEEDENEESGLLHRYLDNQLSLARTIFDDDGDRDNDSIRVPFLS